LMPVVLLVAVLFRQAQAQAQPVAGVRAMPLVPGFLLAFVLLVVLGSLQAIPAPVSEQASHASRAFLVLAIAAAGIKTDFADMLKLGWLPLVMLLSETLWIALWIGLSQPLWG